MTDPIRSHADNANLEAWWQSKLTEAEILLDQNGIEALWWQFNLFDDGIAEDATDLDQAVKIILTTPQGSDIHRPEFSSGIWNYIDYPIPRATPFVVRESTTAIETWEPRVQLDSVDVQPYSPDIQGISVNTSWTVADSEETGQTEVSFG